MTEMTESHRQSLEKLDERLMCRGVWVQPLCSVCGGTLPPHTTGDEPIQGWHLCRMCDRQAAKAIRDDGEDAWKQKQQEEAAR